MNRKSVAHRVTRRGGACLSLMLAVAILIPGCAGKHTDLLSSIIPPKEAAGEGKESQAVDANRIADAKEAKAKAKLSAFTDSEIIEGPPGLLTKFRKRFSRQADEAVTSDPFIAADKTEAAKPETKTGQGAIANDGSPSVEELLASFETEVPQHKTSGLEPWWKTDASSESAQQEKPAVTPNSDPNPEYAQEFDSRLNRLRAELTDPHSKANEFLANAGTVDSSAGKVVETAVAKTEVTIPDNALLTKPVEQIRRTASVETQHPLAADTSWSNPSVADAPLDSSSAAPPGDAKARIKAMLADARRDRENWNLRRAYRTALDAQELAVLENVDFLPHEEQPQQLAAAIAADLRGDAVPTAATNNPVAKAEINPFADETTEVAATAPTDFHFPEFRDSADLWSSLPSNAASASDPLALRDVTSKSGKAASGVSLLPPDDDFPSDAAGSNWHTSFSSLNPLPKLSEPEDIQLTTHKSPGFTTSRDAQPRDQLPGLSAKDNEALLTTVTDQRQRVFESKSVEWPTLASPNRDKSRETAAREPIRIAKAPRFALDDVPADLPIATSSRAGDVGSQATAKVAGNTSLLGQFWRSQPIWLIGGILLLIVALRLLPWPRRETE